MMWQVNFSQDKRVNITSANDMPVFDRSPSVMGIFAADRSFLGEIGVLDGGMTVYGGENVELGIRVSHQTIKL